MTIITAEDDYQVVTIKSKSKANTLTEFVEMCRGIALTLGYDAEQVAERLPAQVELHERWAEKGFKPGEIIGYENDTRDSLASQFDFLVWPYG
jgi:hypothetical protein